MKTYLRHRVNNVVDIKELIALEYLDFEGKYKDYSETHDFWELCYVEKGGITLTVDSVNHILNENQLFIIAPNRRHTYSSHDGNKVRVFVACFESFSHNLLPLSNTSFSLSAIDTACVRQIIAESEATFVVNEDEQLSIKTDAVFGGQQALHLQLEYLLICLLRHLSDRKDSAVVFISDENFHRELTDAIMRYIRENFDKKITLADVCARFSYSQSFICRIFKEQTGETLIEHINRIKIAEACKLLEKTPLKINEISTSLGFGETKYFDTLFKKIIGISPNNYRKEKENGKSN